MTIHTLASGSEGNCLLLSDGGVHLLLDAGISTRRIKAGLLQLGLTMADVAYSLPMSIRITSAACKPW